MKQAILGLSALVLGTIGCEAGYIQKSVGKETGQEVPVKLPKDCLQVVDVRYSSRTKYASALDQVLCRNGDNLVLYIKSVHDESWTARKYLY